MSSRVVIPILASLEQNDKPLVKQVVKGVKQLQHQAIASQSHSTTQTTFNFQPPSQNTIIDRKFELEMDVRFETSLGAQKFKTLNDTSLALNTAGGAPPTDATNRQTIGFRRSSSRTPKGQLNQPATALTAVPASTIATADTAAAVKVALDASLTIINTNLTTALQSDANKRSFAGSDLGQGAVDVLVGNNFAPRQFPLTSCMDSIDVVINGTHFSVSVNQYIHAVMTYTTPEWRDKNLPQCPHAPDTTLNYIDPQFMCGDTNPLSLFGEPFRKGEQPRGAYLQNATDAANSAGDGGAGKLFKLREPLFISPLMSMLGHGLTNVNQIDITIRWASDVSRIFSYEVMSLVNIGSQSAFTDPTNVGNDAAQDALYPLATTMKAVFPTTQAHLNVLYYTPMDDVNIPNEIILPYKQPQIEIVSATDGKNANPALITKATGNNVRLNQIPECVYLFVKQRHGSLGVNNPDNQARITKVSVNWKNQTNILSGYAEKDLIEMALYNGYDSNVEEVIAGKGLVLKLNFGQDLPLDDNESAGTRGDYNWRCDVDFDFTKCLGQKGVVANNDVVFYQVFVMNGHAIVSPNECRVSTGVLSLEDNMGAEEMGHIYNPNSAEVAGGSIIGGSAVGGSLIGGHASHFKKVANMAKLAMDVGKSAHKMGMGVGDAVKEYKSRS